ncbi:MAG: hypothetical protein EXR65_03105 [Dehalococcoidia bacterium]|nr:hypothetical protein [Dehalococcoidia bacterium]
MPDRRRVFALLAAGIALLAAACGGGGGTSESKFAPLVPGSVQKPNEVTINATEYAFKLEGALVPGRNLITLKNGGKEDHHAQLILLDAGKTIADVQQALAKPGTPPTWMHFDGGPGTIAAGGTGVVRQRLAESTYVLACLVPAADGAAHFTKGMISEVKVAGAVNNAETVFEREAVLASDYAFAFASASVYTDGVETAIRLNNNGAEPHELGIVRLSDGKTADDYIAWLKKPQGPSPGVAAGGIGAVDPKAEAKTVIVTPRAGNHIMICMVTDKNGVPHALLGMVKPFKVN